MHQQLTAERLISHHRTREDYVESAPNTLQFGYGDHRYVKFTFELLNQSDILKEKILNQVKEDFSLCNNIDLCLKSSDMLRVLFKHLHHENNSIRLLSTECLSKVCCSGLGRRHVIKNDFIMELEVMINDSEKEIRRAAVEGLISFSEFTDGINVMLQKEKVLPHLVDKLIEEKHIPILVLVIKLLSILMQGQMGTPSALKTEILSRLIHLITHHHQEVREFVCVTLANISFNEQGKSRIVEAGYISNIIPCLQDKCKEVREASCLLLCSLAQLNQGKIEILQQCEFKTIVQLLDEESATALNAVQLIANLAQNPKGRQEASKYMEKLEGLKHVEKHYITATLEVIKWKP